MVLDGLKWAKEEKTTYPNARICVNSRTFAWLCLPKTVLTRRLISFVNSPLVALESKNRFLNMDINDHTCRGLRYLAKFYSADHQKGHTLPEHGRLNAVHLVNFV